ncbi:predicted protein [Naegleria gruberi]|uniref:Predicted protein n=1 Tax=Naegleria gruberi TaxID=5762 RepID=D2VIJ5_NAEGR|nr:uncharacterized protein NAEGRDRAFT_68701 [Naegleria gruberi]EFC43368.1 predicted protein [Naegleria gruberi]|eukprot:XP_002676112.1 predicted protein [Naegleria gruberi strain NEG-M]
MRYYYTGFDVEISMEDVKITLDMWINYFNYFLFCKENNPHFYEFRSVSLPFMAQFSKYERVQTLDVLFGMNIVQFCGKTELTFYNRTLLCLCSDYSTSSNDSITFRSMMGDKCAGSMELFWVPAANHLSLKVIEIVFYFIQSITLPILCLFPIIFRSGIKWKDHMKSRGTLNTIEKGMKTPRQQEPSEKEKNTISNNEQNTNPNQVKIDVVIDNTQSQLCTSNRSNKKESNRNSMKEQLSHELVRVICDLKLLAGISLEFSILCLLGSAIQHTAESKGGAVYPTPTLIVASVAFLCVANIPLAGLFVEVLLKLSGNNKKVSIHGL